jgi:hypothetical protein
MYPGKPVNRRQKTVSLRAVFGVLFHRTPTRGPIHSSGHYAKAQVTYLHCFLLYVATHALQSFTLRISIN